MNRVRQGIPLVVIALMVLIFGGAGSASAQGPTSRAASATASCPPSFEFGCTISGTGAVGLGVNNTSTANNASGVYATLRTPGTGAAAVWGRVLGSGSTRGYGVYGSHQGSGVGVYGHSMYGTGFVGLTYSTAEAPGVLGVHAGTAGTGAGVRGETRSGDDETAGVLGLASATQPISITAGVRGNNNSTSAQGFGVWGSHAGSGAGVYGNSASGYGVQGHSPSSAGVWGSTSSAGDGQGVVGLHAAAEGNGPGVQGQTNSTAEFASGVLGQVSSNAPGGSSAGVRGTNNSTTASGMGVWGSHAGGGTGVYGNSVSGYGVHGYSGTHSGVVGSSASGVGVRGYSDSNYSGYFESNGGTALYSRSSTSTGHYTASGSGNGLEAHSSGEAASAIFARNSNRGYGVWSCVPTTWGPPTCGMPHEAQPPSIYGENRASGDGVLGFAVNGFGVQGISTNASQGAGVYGQGLHGVRGQSTWSGGSGIFGLQGSGLYAGYFSGYVRVSGTLEKSGGSFKIDHPLDPENQYLSHSFVESPDMMNIYNGNVTLDEKGEAVVEMPDYFEALNRDFRYQLTAMGAPGPNLYIAEQMQDRRFKIAGGTPGMMVSWQVTGIRQDPWANDNRIPVAAPKPETERGTYLYPQGYGQPESRGLDAAHEQQSTGSATPGAAPLRAEQEILPAPAPVEAEAPDTLTIEEGEVGPVTPTDTSVPPTTIPDGPANR